MSVAFAVVLVVVGCLLLVLMIAGLVMSVVLLRRRSRTGIGVFTGGERLDADCPALDILETRYAKGELTREQFLQMRRDIES